ncbi:MAG: hypothetical protein L0Y74_10650 [candidate division Zixibacteria bacterium]|nr:hypothetical protein [candidate division Zixibacteria bacterium]
MMDIGTHLGLLGLEAQDKVTGAKGVITSISFDLFGCIQAVLTPKIEKGGEVKSGNWMDVPRLEIKKRKAVMPLPDFAIPYIASGKKGPADKPVKE